MAIADRERRREREQEPERIPLRDVLVDLVRHPQERLIARWNWKSALCSSLMRASLFGSVNAAAGYDAAVAAALTELSYRAVTAGFYGALTQTLSRGEPAWLATLSALVLLPLCGHGVEWVVHWASGTVYLARSVMASISLTVVSTLFNLYAMRRGALIVGEPNAASLLDDVRRLPRLVGGFLTAPLRIWSR